MRPDLRQALAQADADFEAFGLPPTIDARLRARLSESAMPQRRFWPRLALVSVASSLCTLAVLWLIDAEKPPERRPQGLHVESATPDLEVLPTGPHRLTIARGGAVLWSERHGASATLLGPAELSEEGAALRLHRGLVLFSVRKRAPHEPAFRILVSHGAIEVLGTRFLVRQEAATGEVVLEEGAIRFEGAQGTALLSRAGDRLLWPPLPAPVQAAKPVAPAKRGRNPSATVLDEIATLRRAHRYAAAVKRLRRALLQPAGASTREILSFELGTLLSDHLQEPEAACAHWSLHLGQFPEGRYREEIAAFLVRLRCPMRRRF
jgi:transmembrane sensor